MIELRKKVKFDVDQMILDCYYLPDCKIRCRSENIGKGQIISKKRASRFDPERSFNQFYITITCWPVFSFPVRI
ncbi:hypothetical protein CLV51_105309 [Chitinophaga niastensis]|uniref:Uncharacterized protein n=1 Tax=Chitinophaga niastensis TaxID=536980 RepID=A0A2P8HFE3_CHINA|nr:hypothetical protein CLV51_105309 [Chitinophaga niastensis]